MDVELAPPPGFVIVERQAGCAFALGATEVDGVVPSWATCRWPEVPTSEVARVLDDPAGQDAVWSRVLDSQVIGGSEGDWLVWQRHDVELVADREVVVRWTRHDSPAGSSWSWRSVEASLPRQSGNVPCSRQDGSWTLLWVLMGMGYAPELRSGIMGRVRAAQATGNSALDFIGGGGGQMLPPRGERQLA